MNVTLYIIILSIGQLLMACNTKRDISDQQQYEEKHVILTSEEDDPGPPPPNFTSRFKNLQEWLANILRIDDNAFSSPVATKP